MGYGYKPLRQRNIYKPSQTKPFKLSRSKIQNYTECPRCFYFDRRMGLNTPEPAPYNLNSAVDALLKNEFDQHREKQAVPPLLSDIGLDLVPFAHEKMDYWRNALSGGLQFHHEDSNFIITGAIDDIWMDKAGSLYIVDYKATSRKLSIEQKHLWPYKRQVETYQWLLSKEGYKVSPTAYFVYCNASTDRPSFEGRLEFSIKVLPLQGSTRWIEPTLRTIRECLDSDTPPPVSEDCSFCLYYKTLSSLSVEPPVSQL